MTRLVVCSVKDLAAQTFGRPFFVPHANVAVRSFTDEVNSPSQDGSNTLYSHPDDYELYELGLFDDSLGHMLAHEDGPVLIIRGKAVSKRTDTVPTPTLRINGGIDAKSVVL